MVVQRKDRSREIDVYQTAFNVDVVPIAPATKRAGYNGVHYQGTLFVNTDANHGID